MRYLRKAERKQRTDTGNRCDYCSVDSLQKRISEEQVRLKRTAIHYFLLGKKKKKKELDEERQE